MASRCEDGRVTGDFLDELPNFHIEFFSQLEEHPGRFAVVSESDVDKFIEGEENANTNRKTFYDLKLVKNFLVEERREIREIEKIPPTELDGYLSQFVLAARTKTGKDYEPSSLRRILTSVERHLSRYSYITAKPSSKTKRRAEGETKGTQAAWTRKQTKSHNGSYGRRN